LHQQAAEAKGRSYRAIARHFNDQKIITRAGKKWTNEIIKRIIDRYLSGRGPGCRLLDN
jgi:transposase InsO family protein